MNGFAIYSWANIELNYGCRSMPKKEAFSNQHQHQRPFTAKDAEDAKEEKGLRRMNADERGSGIGTSGHRDIGKPEHTTDELG
jgi:hypothetical protein